MTFTSMEELDELIAAGYGDIPQQKIPADWRDRMPSGRKRYTRRQPGEKGKARLWALRQENQQARRARYLQEKSL